MTESTERSPRVTQSRRNARDIEAQVPDKDEEEEAQPSSSPEEPETTAAGTSSPRRHQWGIQWFQGGNIARDGEYR